MHVFRPILLVLLFITLFAPTSHAGTPPWFQRKTTWHGHDQFHFKVAGQAAYMVAPKKPAAGNPWVWRARFPSYHAEMDVTLLGKGYHIGYVNVAGLYGSPRAMQIGDSFYRYMTTARGLSRQPCLEGVSRGGLFVYNWASRNPGKVACIYCDTPVLDFKSWPAGQGDGVGSPDSWRQCLQAYQLTEKDALQYQKNPIDHAEVIAKAGIPLLHIVSENDRVVPPTENTYLLQKRIRDAGHDLDVISVAMGTEKSKGHHFTHPSPARVVQFVLANTKDSTFALRQQVLESKRIVFLGDSITYSGEYVANFEAWLLTQHTGALPLVINQGLPSETVSGLSEKGHAGGRFPRPDLHERLQRVLDTAKPDLIIACYGMNCGIYQPLDAERLERYKSGIQKLRTVASKSGAEVIHLTPPCYDDHRGKKSFSYNDVLGEFSEWLISQRDAGWKVIDLHSIMNQTLQARRKDQADFTFQKDAVHPNSAGHWVMAQALAQGLGDAEIGSYDSAQQMLSQRGLSPDILPLIKNRMAVLRNAYLSKSGHKRPGVRAGVPIDEAHKQASGLSTQIQDAGAAPK